MPILPLRGVVVFPQTAVPLTIGQPRSIKLVDDVVAGDKLIGVVASRNPELENPGPGDLYTVGTLGCCPAAASRSGWHDPPAGAGIGTDPH